MSLHRLVAFVSALTLVGLLGLVGRAEASNYAAPQTKRVIAEQSLRQKVQHADINGCG